MSDADDGCAGSAEDLLARARAAYRRRRLDIGLDPFPYNGATTTCEALWMGVPVIALAGERHAGRVGVSVLAAAGLDGLIAPTVDDYVDLGAALARDLDRLARMRGELRPRLERTPLGDVKRLTRAIEAAYREMWRRWCAAR